MTKGRYTLTAILLSCVSAGAFQCLPAARSRHAVHVARKTSTVLAAKTGGDGSLGGLFSGLLNPNDRASQGGSKNLRRKRNEYVVVVTGTDAPLGAALAKDLVGSSLNGRPVRVVKLVKKDGFKQQQQDASNDMPDTWAARPRKVQMENGKNDVTPQNIFQKAWGMDAPQQRQQNNLVAQNKEEDDKKYDAQGRRVFTPQGLGWMFGKKDEEKGPRGGYKEDSSSSSAFADNSNNQRSSSTSDEEGDYAVAYWDPLSGNMDAAVVEQADAIVHLGGIEGGRRSRDEIARSRVVPVSLLAESIASSRGNRPEVLISASSVEYYGSDQGEQNLSETSPQGTGHAAEVFKQAEKEAAAAADKGVRVVNARLGVVVNRGVSAPVAGENNQYLAWISLRDAVRAIRYMLESKSMSGAVNVVGPKPVTGKEFREALVTANKRPQLFAGLGNIGTEALVSGQRVFPTKLQGSGFKFYDTDIQRAFTEALNSGDA